MLALMCGLPRAGKSVFAAQLQELGWVRLCADDVRIALTGRIYHEGAEAAVWGIMDTVARALLLAGHLVVVDATNIRREHRAKWIETAHALNVPVQIYWIRTSYEVCCERNHGPGKVPDEVLERMYRDFEPPSPHEAELFCYPQRL